MGRSKMKTIANSNFGSQHVSLSNEGYVFKQTSTSGAEVRAKSDSYISGVYYIDQRKCVALLNGSLSNKNIYNRINQSLSGQSSFQIKTTDLKK